jgi:hypothetical protein
LVGRKKRCGGGPTPSRRSLWVNRDRVEPAASPTMSAMEPIAEVNSGDTLSRAVFAVRSLCYPMNPSRITRRSVSPSPVPTSSVPLGGYRPTLGKLLQSRRTGSDGFGHWTVSPFGRHGFHRVHLVQTHLSSVLPFALGTGTSLFPQCKQRVILSIACPPQTLPFCFSFSPQNAGTETFVPAFYGSRLLAQRERRNGGSC